MRDLLKIAQYHCNLFRLHDEAKWEDFSKNVVDYAVALGYKKANAQKAAPHVVDAYKYADKALAAQKQKEYGLEDKLYGKTFGEFYISHKILGAETHSLDYKIGWYKGARHKTHAKVLLSLIMGNFSKFGWKRIGLTSYTTYLSFAKAYPAHRDHDWKRLTAALVDYWTAVSNSYKTEKLPIEL